MRNRYGVLEKAVAKNDKAVVLKALSKLSDHDKDLLVDCPAKSCHSLERVECVGMDAGKVHFGRRVSRLLKGIR